MYFSYMKAKEYVLQKIALWAHLKIGITPNGLSLLRIFLTPWIMLLVVETIHTESVMFFWLTLGVYFFAILTDLFDGPLARAMVARSPQSHDIGYGSVLDRISDKLIIVFSLIPFGFDPFIVLIIIGESMLLYQALHATTTKAKQAVYIGKIKMTLQTFLMPVLLISILYTNILPVKYTFVFLCIVVLFTFLSVVTHYKKEVST